MGFFSSNKTPKYSDKVWKSSSFCLKGMITEALQSITHGNVPVVVTFFSESNESVLGFLSENSVPHFKIENDNSSEALEQSKTIFVIPSVLIDSSAFKSLLPKLNTRQKIDFLFFGHYPLPSKENKVLELLSNTKSSITFYSSLDQPSFEIFGSAQTISLMNTMGLKDDEAIENSMVSKAMTRAREKIESKVKFDNESGSEKDWFHKNVKN
ncbi:MAG: hypothetical protein QM734_15435 [Cyclobacteriaceae bacterium]